jgi:hypothetical protein
MRNKMATVASKNSHAPKNGDADIRRLTRTQLVRFFDEQARDTLGLSGSAALKRIRSGRAGSNLAWTSLRLLSALFSE